jgi:hypothetical protein
MPISSARSMTDDSLGLDFNMIFKVLQREMGFMWRISMKKWAIYVKGKKKYRPTRTKKIKPTI